MTTPAHISPTVPWLLIEAGTRADYGALSRWHYRGGPPATFALVLRAVDLEPAPHAEPTLAGVLVISHPTLNGPWRERAWPGALTPERSAGSPPHDKATHDKAAAARRLNAMVRTISRVIVDPRYRGNGVGSALVRAYVDHPLTPLTEAIAAMGAIVPIFTRAGMREIAPRTDDRARALHRQFRATGKPAWRLLDPREAKRQCRDNAALVHEARRWARASRATRASEAEMTDAQVVALAASAIASPPRVFVEP
jgi:GNAT superfamily N-acetyltransferase